MNHSKDAYNYWQIINRTMLDFDSNIGSIWNIEKSAAVESIQIVREEALRFLATERERIMKFYKEEAIQELLKASKLENKMRAINSVSANGLLTIS